MSSALIEAAGRSSSETLPASRCSVSHKEIDVWVGRVSLHLLEAVADRQENNTHNDEQGGNNERQERRVEGYQYPCHNKYYTDDHRLLLTPASLRKLIIAE